MILNMFLCHPKVDALYKAGWSTNSSASLLASDSHQQDSNKVESVNSKYIEWNMAHDRVDSFVLSQFFERVNFADNQVEHSANQVDFYHNRVDSGQHIF